MNDIEIDVEQVNNVEVELENVNPIITSDHAQLTHLDYASSGHTGFASSVELTSEQTARQNADTQEATARESADDTLQDNIDAEESARETADNTLDEKIDEEIERATAKENEIAEDLSDETTARTTADTNLQTNITNEATSRANADTGLSNRIIAIENDYLKQADKTLLQNQITTNKNDIDRIKEKIPNGASSVNQLADKSFVNSSIATNTAYFLGTLDVVQDLGLQYKATTTAIVTKLNDYEFTSGPTNNDYVFVVNKDNDNNILYQRFKYNASETTFLYEYSLNNSSFTQAQWNAINSGATDVLIGKITTNESAIATEITDRQTAVSNEATARSTADTSLQTNIDNEKARAEGVESGLDTRLDTIEADYLKASDKTELQNQITQNANDIDTLESGKQDNLTSAQLTAVNSGIDTTKVAQIQTNADDIDAIENKLDQATVQPSPTTDKVFESGQGLALKDKSQMVITEIEGNSYAWNQIVENGNFSNGINNWNYQYCSYQINNNEITITTNANAWGVVNQQISLTLNHKYLLLGSIKNVSGSMGFGIYYNNETNYYSNIDSGYFFTPTTNATFRVNLQTLNGSGSNQATYKNIQLFDLTLIYESGNEPTTLADFQQRFNALYYPYDAGSIKVSDNEIVSENENIWDEVLRNGYYNRTTGAFVSDNTYKANANLIRVIPNTDYYFNASAITVFYFDSNKNYISNFGVITNTALQTPINCYYIGFDYGIAASNTHIAIKLNSNHDKSYKPHTQDKLLMSGRVIRKIGVVDLGSLNYTYNSIGHYFSLSTSTILKAPLNNSITPNIICGIYQTQTPGNVINNYSDSRGFDKIISISTNGRVIIYDSTYTDTTLLKSSLNGINLVGELTTPTAEHFTGTHTPLYKIGNIADKIINDSGVAVYKYGLIYQSGIPYTLENKYAVSISEQLANNVSVDRAQQEEMKGLQAQIDKLKEQHEDLSIYGIKRELANSNSAWVRTDKSIGLVANATKDGTSVKNDFDNIPLWKKIISVNMNDNGSINAYYGDTNFTFNGTNGEVMTRIPTHYYKRWKENGYEYIQVSESNFTGATKINEYYIGRYTTSTGAHSYSGVSSQVNTNITNFRTQAQAKGSGWQQLDYHWFDLLNLYLVEYADYNIQNILGKGNTSNSAQITLGGCDTLGMKSGCLANDGLHAVIYRGVENIFGNIYQFVDGINIKDNVAYISYTPSQYAVDTFNGCYEQVGYTNATSTGYAKELGMDDNNQLCALPISVGGSTTTYVSAYYYQNPGNRIALFGGYWDVGAIAGFYWFVGFNSSSADVYFGTRLIKIN